MQYRVRHRTLYRYLQDVSNSCHMAHLLPRDTGVQTVREAELTCHPAPANMERRIDYFGNVQNLFTVEQSHDTLEIVSESLVDVSPPPVHVREDDMAWESVRAILEAGEGPHDAAATRDATQYVFDSPLIAAQPDFAAYAEKSFTPGRGILTAAAALTTAIHRDFHYDTTVTDAYTPVDKVFRIRAGVCQDLAHVAIACLRAIGLSARYVSGYLLTAPPPGQPRLIGADASHAWFAIWVPSCGWVDFDPTNNVQAGETHITTAWGRDYSDVAPIGGVVTGGGDHVIEVGVDVLPADAEAE